MPEEEAGGGRCTTPCQWQKELSVTDPREDPPKNHRKESSITAPTGQDEYGPCYKKPTIPATQPVRNGHHPRLLTSLQQTSAQNTPPNFLLLLRKIMFLSFLCWSCLWFCCGLLVPDCNSPPFLNKLIFACQVTGSFHFKVNITPVISFGSC